MRTTFVIVMLAGVMLGLALSWMPSASPRSTPGEQASGGAGGGESQAGGHTLPATPEPDPEAQGTPEPGSPSVPEPDPAVAQGAPPHPSSPEYAALLAARFDTDPPDVDGGLERDIARKVAARMPAGSRLDSIECRAMLCRLRSLHLNMQAYEAFIRDAFSAPEPEQRVWTGQTWIAAPSMTPNQGAAARIESVIYLQRDPNPVLTP